jgi:beta-mannanase
VSGRYDALIKQRADGMRNLHAPAFLRFYWEMDGNKKDKWSKSPAEFVAAWRHVHAIFAAEGANNVAWVWCPNAWAFDVNTQNAAQWYPGNDVVDWICADGYNWARPGSTAKPASLQKIFQNFYNWAGTKNKPLMIGEFGAIETAPGQKAAWINAARTTLKTRFTKIKAIVYYDEYRHEDNTIYDWRLDSSAGSYAAWNNLAKDPYFNRR